MTDHLVTIAVTLKVGGGDSPYVDQQARDAAATALEIVSEAVAASPRIAESDQAVQYVGGAATSPLKRTA